MASTKQKNTRDDTWAHHSQNRNTSRTSSSAHKRNTNDRSPGAAAADDFSTENDFDDDDEWEENVIQNNRGRGADVYYKNEPTTLVSLRLPTRIVGNIDKASAQMNANGHPTNRTQLIARLLDLPSEMLTRMILKVRR